MALWTLLRVLRCIFQLPFDSSYKRPATWNSEEPPFSSWLSLESNIYTCYKCVCVCAHIYIYMGNLASLVEEA